MQKLLLESAVNPQLSDAVRILNKYKGNDSLISMVFGVADNLSYFSDMFTSVPFNKDGRPNSKFLAEAAKFIDGFIKSGKSGAELITKDVEQDILKLGTMFMKDSNLSAAAQKAFKAKKIHLGGRSDLTEVFMKTYKEFKELKATSVQKVLATAKDAIITKSDEGKKVVESVSATVKAAVQNVSQSVKVASNVAKDPAKFYPMVVYQGNMLEKYAKAAPAAKSVPEVKKVADNLKSVADLGKEVKAAKDAVEKGTEAAKAAGETVKKGAEAAKATEKAVEQGANVVKKATQETVKAIASGKTKIITSVVVAVVALVSAPLIAGWREKASIAKVKELTENALNSKNYQDLAKYIGLLKKMQAKNTFMDKLMVADAASKLAEGNLADIKKGYTICGATMIAASVVLCLLVGVASNVIGTLKEMISNPSFNSILSAIGKLAVLGILLAPALVGICLIKVAQDGFNEEGPAAYIVSLLSPVISLCNYCIKGVMELIANAEANKMNNNSSDKDKYISTLKSMKYQLDKMLANEKIS